MSGTLSSVDAIRFPVDIVDHQASGVLALHWQHIRRYMGVVLSQYGARDSVWREHAAIVKAIAAGDAAQAHALARSHAVEASLNLLRHLAASPPPAPARRSA